MESILDLVKTIQKTSNNNSEIYQTMKMQRLFLLEGDKNHSKIAGGNINHLKLQAGISMFQKFKYAKSSTTFS